ETHPVMSLIFRAFFLLLCVAGILARGKRNDTDIDIEPRIVGGTRATSGQFPHQIALRNRGSFICGGSILSNNYVLTAAHCVKSGNNVTPASQLDVQAGSLTLSDGGVRVKVAAVTVNPSYKGKGHDVAVLRLEKNLDFSSQIKAIKLATSDPPNDATVEISGWGRISQGGPISNNLLYLRVKHISRETCQRRYMRDLYDTTMCLLHDSKKGACNGDSGGPATYEGQLVGVASFVIGGCARAAPDGYERVSKLNQWIKENAHL
ncbi:hypothetical protein KR074_006834, partial [Drosophila pseudoananassae]